MEFLGWRYQIPPTLSLALFVHVILEQDDTPSGFFASLKNDNEGDRRREGSRTKSSIPLRSTQDDPREQCYKWQHRLYLAFSLFSQKVFCATFFQKSSESRVPASLRPRASPLYCKYFTTQREYFQSKYCDILWKNVYNITIFWGIAKLYNKKITRTQYIDWN